MIFRNFTFQLGHRKVREEASSWGGYNQFKCNWNSNSLSMSTPISWFTDFFYREKNLATIAPELYLLQLESLKRKNLNLQGPKFKYPREELQLSWSQVPVPGQTNSQEKREYWCIKWLLLQQPGSRAWLGNSKRKETEAEQSRKSHKCWLKWCQKTEITE